MKLKDIFPYWTEIRPVLAEAVAPLGPEELGWRPPGGPNAVGDLAWHILEVEERDVHRAAIGRPGGVVDPERPSRELGRLRAGPLPAGFDGRRLAEALLAGRDEVEQYLRATDAETLFLPCRRKRGGPTVGESLWNAFVEEVHHRGQVFMLLRMMGRTPPAI